MIALLVAALFMVDWETAEHEYFAGRHAEAYALFEAALAEGELAAGPLRYNLGNCAYRLGRHAEAALHYRRALRDLPGDSQVLANLRLAEERLGLGAAQPRTLPARARAAYAEWTPAKRLLFVTLLQTVALAAVLVVRRRLPRWLQAVLLATAFLAALAFARAHLLDPPPEGVVLRDATMHSGPHPTRTAVAQLRPGEVVRLEESSDRWIRVRHPLGEGWVALEAVGRID